MRGGYSKPFDAFSVSNCLWIEECRATYERLVDKNAPSLGQCGPSDLPNKGSRRLMPLKVKAVIDLETTKNTYGKHRFKMGLSTLKPKSYRRAMRSHFRSSKKLKSFIRRQEKTIKGGTSINAREAF
ncbi:hypothetical protein Tco_0648456 [Tanacetum coccineum]